MERVMDGHSEPQAPPTSTEKHHRTMGKPKRSPPTATTAAVAEFNPQGRMKAVPAFSETNNKSKQESPWSFQPSQNNNKADVSSSSFLRHLSSSRRGLGATTTTRSKASTSQHNLERRISTIGQKRKNRRHQDHDDDDDDDKEEENRHDDPFEDEEGGRTSIGPLAKPFQAPNSPVPNESKMTKKKKNKKNKKNPPEEEPVSRPQSLTEGSTTIDSNKNKNNKGSIVLKEADSPTAKQPNETRRVAADTTNPPPPLSTDNNDQHNQPTATHNNNKKNKRKRLKVRSRQKNIRKDTRPDHAKPLHLQLHGRPSFQPYQGRPLTAETRRYCSRTRHEKQPAEP